MVDYPIPTNDAEEWCKKNGVKMSFYERQEGNHLLNFIGLSKGELEVEYSYALGHPERREIVVTLAIRRMESMIRDRERIQ